MANNLFVPKEIDDKSAEELTEIVEHKDEDQEELTQILEEVEFLEKQDNNYIRNFRYKDWGPLFRACRGDLPGGKEITYRNILFGLIKSSKYKDSSSQETHDIHIPFQSVQTYKHYVKKHNLDYGDALENLIITDDLQRELRSCANR